MGRRMILTAIAPQWANRSRPLLQSGESLRDVVSCRPMSRCHPRCKLNCDEIINETKFRPTEIQWGGIACLPTSLTLSLLTCFYSALEGKRNADRPRRAGQGTRRGEPRCPGFSTFSRHARANALRA
jgi:hypothetical protein